MRSSSTDVGLYFENSIVDMAKVIRNTKPDSMRAARGRIEVNRFCIFSGTLLIGVWRSLGARTAGGRKVAGSNPVTPTKMHASGGIGRRADLKHQYLIV